MDLLVCGCKVTKCDCEWIANGFANRKPRTTFAVIVRLLMSAGFCIVASGCDGVFVKPSGPVNPVPVVVTETRWTLMADDIDAGTHKNTTQLELIVKRMKARERITAAQVDAFYAALGGERTKDGDLKTERALTSDDSAKIRAIQ